MAGTATYIVVLDANVLYPVSVIELAAKIPGRFKAMRSGWNSPAYTAMQLVEFYARIGLTQTSDFLRSAIKLI